jgi:hypothetical protein
MAKNYKEYSIQRPGFTDRVEVRVYKNAQKMRNGNLLEQRKYYKRFNIAPDNAIGIFFRSPAFKPKGNENVFSGETVGIIFLNEQNLTYDVIIHECCHCAFAHEKDINCYKMDYGDDADIEHEERFCYYLDWLAAEVLQLLKQQGYFK